MSSIQEAVDRKRLLEILEKDSKVLVEIQQTLEALLQKVEQVKTHLVPGR